MRDGVSLLVAVVCLAGGWSAALADAPDVGLQAAADASGARSVSVQASSEDGAASLQRRIEQLIRELGSPRYTIRRTAANELREIGAEGFDLLHTATDSGDPEVAASANYLLREIRVRWVQSDDPPSVRRVLRDYGDKSEEARLGIIEGLSKLPNQEGAAGLCRVARFDRSPLLARAAAHEVIRPDDRDPTSMPVDPEAIDRELGESTRVAATWLRQYRVQLRDPAASVDGWERIVDEETEVFERNRDETTDEIVLGLMWNLADVYRQLDHRPALMQMVDRMIQLDVDSAERMTVLLLWLVERESWAALDDFLAKYDTQLQEAKRSLYIVALARAKQGNEPLAEKLAEKAAELESQHLLEGFWIAKYLEQRNQYEWSLREYRRVVDREQLDPRSQEAILARVSLANMQHDHGQFEDAADVLEPLVKAIQEDGEVAQHYTDVRRHHILHQELYLPERESLSAKFHYYRAGQYHAQQNWDKEREHLESAIRFDELDADVVIQMYRLPNADDKWRAMVRRRIGELCELFAQQINAAPSDPTAYNQWAWLVSNTEGDYQEAVRKSHRSLEILGPSGSDSGQASFLDTLGRCYYAAGDLENAVKYQRQAIEKLDYMQVMHRQLALFEEALAEQKKSENGSAAEES